MKNFIVLFFSVFILFGCSSGEEQSVSIEGTEWVSIENGTTGDADDIESGKQVGTYYRIGITQIDISQTESKRSPHKYSGIYKYDYPGFIIEMDNGALAKYDIGNGVMTLAGGYDSYGGISFPGKMFLCADGESTYKETIIDILTYKTWKLSRLTDEGSNRQFYSGLWKDAEAERRSRELLREGDSFTLNFVGHELNGELSGTIVVGRAGYSEFNGTWSGDGSTGELSIKVKTNYQESDALSKAFIFGLQNVYKYEGDSNSLTLFFRDGAKTRVMGFIPVR